MKIACSFVALSVLGLFGCASNEKPCESILEVKRQRTECQQLRKAMQHSSNPQLALTARQRYEQSCLNLRYYRDDFDTICMGEQKPIDDVNEPVITDDSINRQPIK